MISQHDLSEEDLLRITIVGRRNAGKSSLLNALASRPVAAVSDVPGTTVEPVSAVVSLAYLGPALVSDTPGIDDFGVLGELRIKRTMRAVRRSGLVLLVVESGTTPGQGEQEIVEEALRGLIPVVVVATKADSHPDYGEVRLWARVRALPFIALSTLVPFDLERLARVLCEVVPPHSASASSWQSPVA